jgi:hypothetical protein
MRTTYDEGRGGFGTGASRQGFKASGQRFQEFIFYRQHKPDFKVRPWLAYVCGSTALSTMTLCAGILLGFLCNSAAVLPFFITGLTDEKTIDYRCLGTVFGAWRSARRRRQGTFGTAKQNENL